MHYSAFAIFAFLAVFIADSSDSVKIEIPDEIFNMDCMLEGVEKAEIESLIEENENCFQETKVSLADFVQFSFCPQTYFEGLGNPKTLGDLNKIENLYNVDHVDAKLKEYISCAWNKVNNWADEDISICDSISAKDSLDTLFKRMLCYSHVSLSG